MPKRPKLRMTNADYVAIGVSPALIMALVGSLVFFLIEVLYVGQYPGRLNYVFALFVFATVLIGRISIEMGADRAALFALPLGIAMFLVLAKFVPHASPYSHLINLALLGLVWWSTHKLTWDCTLIDDNEDASGEGLMQHVGVDVLEAEEEPGSGENELFADEKAKPTNTPHTPGLWVLYFSLAALPLFGLGQKWIPPSDLGRRQYAFGLLAVYVAAGLALLVTTSFLGLRRYLRQRQVEMPAPMAATWVATGGGLIVVVMLLAALIPRPQAEYAISQVPWQVHSPSDLASSRTSFGEEGTEDDRPENEDNARKVLNDETDPEATATREGDQPTTTSEEGEKKISGGESSEEGQEPSPSSQSEEGEPTGDHEASKSETQAEQQPKSEQSEIAAPSDQSSDDGKPPETPVGSTENSQPADDSGSDSASEPSRSPQPMPNLLPVVGGLVRIFKLVLYAVIALALGYLAWQHRRQIAAALADIVQQIRKLLAQFFGGSRAKPASVADDASVKAVRPALRSFASYSDPFASAQYQGMPPEELVRYSFEAFEAWARERGFPRRPDQTPLELIRQAVPRQSPLLVEASHLARLYNEAAYAPNSVSSASVANLAQLWGLMRQSPKTPLESVS